MHPAPLAQITLSGSFVSLEPLSLSHLPALLRVAADPREAYPFTSVERTEEGMRAYLELALREHARGVALPFVTRLIASGEVVGSTRFANVERWAWREGAVDAGRPIDAVEIGWTWLSPDAQRTGANTDAKLLMFTHAFEVWGVRRVTLKTDSRNQRSRDAIARLGCTLDGVLRANGPGWDGRTRDAAVFSLLEHEWPAAKARLEARRSRP